jgi:transposase
LIQPYPRQAVYFQDEMRLGTRTELKRRWTPQGHRPKTPVRIGYQFCYLYAAICPFTGQAFAMLLPQMNKECFGLFVQQFEQHLALQQPALLIAELIADRAATHQAALTEGTAVTLAHLPTACPELNPVERFFKQMRAQLANTVFDSLEQAQQKVTQVFKQLTESTQNMIRLTLFPYIQNTHT